MVNVTYPHNVLYTHCVSFIVLYTRLQDWSARWEFMRWGTYPHL